MQRRAQLGFSLVEMLVSLALFTIIATIAVGTLLVLISGNSKVVEEQTVLTSISFALDSMTREIRTGSEYYCDDVATVTGAGVNASNTAVRDCATGEDGFSFREAGESLTGSTGSHRIAYYFENNTIMRKIEGATAVSMFGDDVKINDAKFIVTGANPLGTGTDRLQPSVTIMLEAEAANMAKSFTIQTTVVQRPLDI